MSEDVKLSNNFSTHEQQAPPAAAAAQPTAGPVSGVRALNSQNRDISKAAGHGKPPPSPPCFMPGSSPREPVRWDFFSSTLIQFLDRFPPASPA